MNRLGYRLCFFLSLFFLIHTWVWGKDRVIKAVAEVKVETPEGTVPQLPWQVWVTYTDGYGEWRQVRWSNSSETEETQQADKEKNPVGTSYTVQGFKALDTLRSSTGLVFLILGLILACGNYLRADGPWDSFVFRCFGFYESFMCISLSFGLIWLFRDYFNNSNRFLSWLSPLTFGVYLIHLPLMIIIEFAVDSVVMDAFWKFLFIGTVTTIGSFVIVWLLRHIPGVRIVM